MTDTARPRDRGARERSEGPGAEGPRLPAERQVRLNRQNIFSVWDNLSELCAAGTTGHRPSRRLFVSVRQNAFENS